MNQTAIMKLTHALLTLQAEKSGIVSLRDGVTFGYSYKYSVFPLPPGHEHDIQRLSIEEGKVPSGSTLRLEDSGRRKES